MFSNRKRKGSYRTELETPDLTALTGQKARLFLPSSPSSSCFSFSKMGSMYSFGHWDVRIGITVAVGCIILLKRDNELRDNIVEQVLVLFS